MIATTQQPAQPDLLLFVNLLLTMAIAYLCTRPPTSRRRGCMGPSDRAGAVRILDLEVLCDANDQGSIESEWLIEVGLGGEMDLPGFGPSCSEQDLHFDPISKLDFTSSSPSHPPAMPSRKSDSSETKAESRRSSLRRLSSIASFHTLNPFTRRRSNNNVTGISSSTSNASLSSSTLAHPPDNAKDKDKDFNSSQIFTEHDNIQAVPPPPTQTQVQYPSRRSSYICLPDDPIGGMPRSRTFSNLPLLTRAKKSNNPLVQSKSHARLPSSLLSASRLPSPSASTRKHSSTTRLAAVENLPRGKKLSRSDTEPLLHAAYEQSPGYHRSTAFKENISLSPIKPLSSMDMLDSDSFYSSSPPSRTYQSRHARSQSREVLQQLSSSANTLSGSTLSLSKYEQLPAGAYKRLSQKYESSPEYRSSRDRAPTPGKPVQRWNSQPVLTNKSNRISPHGEIKQTRLMSAKQAPTPPPPPKTPLRDIILEQPKSKTDENQPGHVRQVSEQTPIAQSQPVQSRSRAQTLEPTAGSVYRAEPLAYWTGRFSSLNDRYRNQDLLASINLGPESPSNQSSPFAHTSDKSKSETDKMHTPAANTARMRRAVERLYFQCANDEARESFLKWQKQLAVALSLPELARPVVGKSCALEMSLREGGQQGNGSSPGMPLSAGRKISFMDRLLGRRQKSLVSSGG
ncbi:hypothetical protein M409DRAFT_54224 [Zasmidium cellare ATCC 36951]|uniref:Uncharacterized protein n=1 Tax=Zasmidium cellare ATCC 36951 TaxID=1080233 RepID=A0A6A6CIM6_ZASCE|nr:uncharacterized protein M409DRAFT_54224 [Zasmidium cellare ATCC 36951]KAF2167005.1 hypothetical protein M409DRAFT_54224 [Zasmidium cellare ATCC 36951]